MRLVLMILALAAFLPLASAQPRVADEHEYQFARRASMEREPAAQLKILEEWESAYPATELQRMRILRFISAYERLGQTTDAFARAVQLFRLDAKDIEASGWVSAIAPGLQSPSPDQIKTTQEAAANLLLRAAELRRARAAAQTRDNDTDPEQVSDPDLRRLAELISEWRRNPHVEPDVVSNLEAVANRALAWAQSASK